MKKLIVLVSALLLVSMAAMADHDAVMAEGDVILSGKVEMRWLNDFSNKTFGDANVVEMKLDATIMDYNSLYIELEEGAGGAGFTSDGGGTLDLLDRAHFTTDLGAIFDLPVGVTVLTGYEEYKFDEALVTEGEWEAGESGSDVKYWGHKIEVMVQEMVTVGLFFANDPAVESLGVGVTVNYDPVSATVAYVQTGKADETAGAFIADNGDSIGYGDIEAGASFGMEVADGIDVAAAVNVDYDLLEGDAAKSATKGEYDGDTQWTLGAGATATYMDMYTLALAWAGQQDAETGGMQIGLHGAPSEDLEVNVFIGLGLDDIYEETFDSAEGSISYNLGASKWTMGLLWINEDDPLTAATIGKIAKEKAEVTPAAESTSLFMRAELAY